MFQVATTSGNEEERGGESRNLFAYPLLLIDFWWLFFSSPLNGIFGLNLPRGSRERYVWCWRNVRIGTEVWGKLFYEKLSSSLQASNKRGPGEKAIQKITRKARIARTSRSPKMAAAAFSHYLCAGTSLPKWRICRRRAENENSKFETGKADGIKNSGIPPSSCFPATAPNTPHFPNCVYANVNLEPRKQWKRPFPSASLRSECWCLLVVHSEG